MRAGAEEGCYMAVPLFDSHALCSPSGQIHYVAPTSMKLSSMFTLPAASLLLTVLVGAPCLSHAYIRPLHMSQSQLQQSMSQPAASSPSTSSATSPTFLAGIDRRNLLTKGFLGGAAAAFTGTFTLTTGAQKAGADVPAEGIEAPDFSLPSSLGKPLSLADLTKGGKYTVLYFFPQVFTSSCTLEAKAFQRDIDNYKKLNAQIVGVSVDESDKQTDFKSECGLDFIRTYQNLK